MHKGKLYFLFCCASDYQNKRLSAIKCKRLRLTNECNDSVWFTMQKQLGCSKPSNYAIDDDGCEL